MRRFGHLLIIAFLLPLSSCGKHLRTDGIYVIPHRLLFDFQQVYQEIDPDSVDIELLEWVVFSLTNIQREQHGLPPFRLSYKLQQAARQHSAEMDRLDYFSHTSPVQEYHTLARRLSHEKVRAARAAENIAIQPARNQLPIVYSYPVGEEYRWRTFWRNYGRPYTYLEFGETLVRRWMHSPGHRHNILDRDFVYLGVGAAAGEYFGYRVLFFTQDFSATNW